VNGRILRFHVGGQPEGSSPTGNISGRLEAACVPTDGTLVAHISGRLENSVSDFLAPLIDHQLVELQAFCTHAPQKLEIFSPIEISLSVYALPALFARKSAVPVRPVKDASR